MKAPDGTICTQFELHDSEDASLIKMDLLSVEAMDKIHNCIDLICDAGYFERKATLRETYEAMIGIYNIERYDQKMWQMVWNHQINSLFQLEQQSGINGIALTHPKSVAELAVLNSVIRLMASERGAEQPLDMWARYRNNIDQWISEMKTFGLTEDEINWLRNSDAISDGMCESQEGLMSLIQDERLGGNNLSFADKCRKSIAKKQGKLFEECEQKYFENAKVKNCSEKLVDYVWNVLLKVQRGYSFCRAHTLAYSLVALQEMNLAYKYPIIFWNTACLISDAGGAEDDELDEEVMEENKVEEIYYNEMEEFTDDDTEDSSYSEDEDCDGYPNDVIITIDGKKKKKTKTTNFGKIASAIGKIKAAGVSVVGPDINYSTYTFSPDVEHNTIRYGLSGITRIGDDIVKEIIANRPYENWRDLCNKIKITKPQMINLIKSGAFDNLGNRANIMREYIDSVCDKKKRLTLQNVKMLMDYNMFPEKYGMACRVYNFTKYLKKFKIDSSYYNIDKIAFAFLENNFGIDNLEISNDTESGFKLNQKTWDKIYQTYMNELREYIKANHDELLDKLNTYLFDELWNKYSTGSYSKWEMDSVSFYQHEHELLEVYHNNKYLDDFSKLSTTPEIEKMMPMKDKVIPIYRLSRIAGTVLDRNKNKKTVTLLANDQVVTVKIYGNTFAQFDKQISERGADGKKHVIDGSWFARGTKLIITGIRQDDEFLAKKYSRTPFPLIEKIIKIDGGEYISLDSRVGEEE